MLTFIEISKKKKYNGRKEILNVTNVQISVMLVKINPKNGSEKYYSLM